MFCQLVLLILLFSLQPGRLQEEGTDISDVFQNINSNMVNLNSLIRSHIREFKQFRDQIENNFSSLRADLNSLNDSVSNLSMCLQEHKQQTAADMQQLNTRLDTLTTIQQYDPEPDSPTQTTSAIPDNPVSATNATTTITPTIPPYTCGGTIGWRRVVYLDMTDPSTTCPSGWQLTAYSKRTCGRASDGRLTCDSVAFPVSGGEYSRVCGRIKAYQWGATHAFWSYPNRFVPDIDDYYVDGVSVTYGYPRHHIWTFAAGLSEGNHRQNAYSVCPCDASYAIDIPPFVGEDYFCESGVNEAWHNNYTLYSSDPLWDGEDCLSSSTCCSLHNPPYFVKQLTSSITDSIEARIGQSGRLQHGNIAVELVELYVQ